MKALVFIITLGSCMTALAYRNALIVGITHDQMIAYIKLHALWVGGIAAVIFSGFMLTAVVQALLAQRRLTKRLAAHESEGA